MKPKKPETNRQLLRTVYPKLYTQLMDELASSNIHPYDVTASSKKVKDGLEIQVCFGENFAQELTRIFSEERLNEKNNEFANFCKEVGETCKETLIADYFKMVKP